MLICGSSSLSAPQADILQMEPPELYVRQNPTPNAYTLAISGRKPFIVVHTSLLELLTPRELQAVLAHGEGCVTQLVLCLNSRL
jgi:hypothetical protein